MTNNSESFDESIVISGGEEEGADYRGSASDRQEAADALKLWIDKHNPENRHILERLEQDLRHEERLNEWGQFALEDLLRAPRRDITNLRFHQIAERITAFRNLVLFLPVFVTWLAIDLAAGNYKEMIDEEVTFLQAWMNSPLSLERTALIDALLIGILVVLTFLERQFEIRAEKQADELDRVTESDFRETMVKVGLYLHGFRAITPGALKSGLAEAVVNLRKSSEQLAAVTSRATDTLTQFAHVSTTQMEPAVRRIDSIVASLGSAVVAHEQMGQMVLTLQQNLGSTLSAVTNQIDHFGNGVQRQFEDHIVTLEKAIRGLMQETESVARNLNGAAASAREVALLYRDGVGSR